MRPVQNAWGQGLRSCLQWGHFLPFNWHGTSISFNEKGESKKKENVFLHTCIRVHKFINLNFISYIFEKLFPNTITLLGMISLSNLFCNFLLTYNFISYFCARTL